MKGLKGSLFLSSFVLSFPHRLSVFRSLFIPTFSQLVSICPVWGPVSHILLAAHITCYKASCLMELHSWKISI